MKSLTCWKSAAAAAALLGAFVQPASADAVSLTLNVTNVARNDCIGLVQPTCTLFNAAGFAETLWIDATVLSALAGPGTLSTATYGFPFSSFGNPYTASLQSILTQVPTSTSALSQFDNVFSGGTGTASALIYSDQSYDDGQGSTGEFSQTYSLLSVLASLGDYNDLTSTSLFSFLSPLTDQLSGSYFAFGNAQTLDAAGGEFTSYAYTGYTGDVTLVAVALIPEPATLALVAAALAAAGMSRRAARRTVDVARAV